MSGPTHRDRAENDRICNALDIRTGLVLARAQLLAIAKWHRAEVKRELRRARGRTVGYVELIVTPSKKFAAVYEDSFSNDRSGFEPDALVARVVLEPRRKK